MSVAAELAEKWFPETKGVTDYALNNGNRSLCAAAISEAIERIAHEVEKFGYHNGHRSCSELFAGRIRALKE